MNGRRVWSRLIRMGGGVLPGWNIKDLGEGARRE